MGCFFRNKINHFSNGAIIAGIAPSSFIICALQGKTVRDFCQFVVIYQIPCQRTPLRSKVQAGLVQLSCDMCTTLFYILFADLWELCQLCSSKYVLCVLTGR